MDVRDQRRLRSFAEQIKLRDLPGGAAEPAAAAALQKLAAGEPLEELDATCLEEIVLQSSRPVLTVRGGTVEAPSSSPWTIRLNDNRAMLERVIRSVGRINVANVPGLQFAGSGFMVAEGVVMTTRRVAEFFTTGVGRTGLAFRPGRRPAVDLRCEGGAHGLEAHVTEIVLIHPFLDLALVRVDLSGEQALPLMLSPLSAEDLAGRPVAVIGHVAYDPGRDLEVLTRNFGGRLGDKHVSPGYVFGSGIMESFGQQMWALTHDCSVLAGSSGGPVVDLATGEVVGLHVEGTRFGPNFAIPMSEVARDSRVVAGLEFARPVQSSSNAWNDDWDRVDPAEIGVGPRRQAILPMAAAGLRDQVRTLVDAAFGTVEEFVEFLGANGYGSTVEVVPRGIGTPDGEYVGALLTALERRGRLDDAFLRSVRSAAGLSVLPAREPSDLELVPGHEPDGQGSALSAGDADEPEPAAAGGRPYDSLVPVLPASEEIRSMSYFSRGVEASRAVVLVQVREEGSGDPSYGGTGWLLTSSLVVVAAHLLQDPREQPDRAKAVGRANSCQVRLDFDTADAPPDWRPVQAVELFDPKLDLALLRLREAVSDRAPLRVSADPPAMASTLVTAIHHPELGAKRLSMGGRLLEADAHQAIYTLTTLPGSAGAPIFDSGWRVVATHRGRQTYRPSPEAARVTAKYGTSTGALLKALREAGGTSGQLWREVVAAQPALKLVDPLLYTRLAGLGRQESSSVVPMVIEVLGPSVTLDDVPGLEVSTRGDFVVTAVGTRESLDALAVRPEVLAVKASPQAGAVECVRSIPHTGASRIHETLGENGDRALIGVIDNGADIFHQSLRDADGRTRILAFWDQRDARSPASKRESQAAVSVSPEGKEMVAACGLTYGALYLRDDLQRFIDGDDPLPETFPPAARMRHGTTVCSIAAGRRTGESEHHFPGGVAPAASLVVVRFDLLDATVGYNKGHIDALVFIDRLASRLGRAVVVNISNGMNAGAHDGSSSVERACQSFTNNGGAEGRVIVKSAGNENGTARHAMFTVPQGGVRELRWRSKAPQPGGAAVPQEIVELWFSSINQYSFRVKAPTGDWSPAISPFPTERRRFHEYLDNGNLVDATLHPSHTDNGDGALRLVVEPGRIPEVESGEWVLEAEGLHVKTKDPVHAWVDEPPGRELHFLDFIRDECTVTIPGTAAHVITVGAIEIDDRMRPYPLSSLGPTRKGLEKPEVVAPGVGIRAAETGSGDGVDSAEAAEVHGSGTSIAAPHVTGAIALALSARAKLAGQPQLNASQIRTALLNSLRHFTSTWVEDTGYGELDAAAFFDLVMTY